MKKNQTIFSMLMILGFAGTLNAQFNPGARTVIVKNDTPHSFNMNFQARPSSDKDFNPKSEGKNLAYSGSTFIEPNGRSYISVPNYLLAFEESSFEIETVPANLIDTDYPNTLPRIVKSLRWDSGVNALSSLFSTPDFKKGNYRSASQKLYFPEGVYYSSITNDLSSSSTGASSYSSSGGGSSSSSNGGGSSSSSGSSSYSSSTTSSAWGSSSSSASYGSSSGGSSSSASVASSSSSGVGYAASSEKSVFMVVVPEIYLHLGFQHTSEGIVVQITEVEEDKYDLRRDLRL